MLKHAVLFCALMMLSSGLALPVSAANFHKNAPVAAPVVAQPKAATVASESHAAETTHEEASGGLPQMDVSRFPGQLFWLTITFILTYGLMKHVALPGVEKTLAHREQRIAADIGGSKAKNEAAKHLMTEVETRIAKARSDAQGKNRAVVDESAKKATDALDVLTVRVTHDIKTADARIREQKNKAMASLDKEVISVVNALVKGVAGISPSTKDIEAALKKVRQA